MGLGDRGVLIGVMTALAESDLYNYANDGTSPRLTGPEKAQAAESMTFPHDKVGRDWISLGLFQQVPQWWGTVPDLMDPAVAARKFYAALKRVSGWELLEPWVSAQTVQRSSFNGVTKGPDGRVREFGANYRARLEQAHRVVNGGPRYFTEGGR
jgi:crotonobetainyl-CoA:carnitine CoA-transferase CaiB-like acyl-CoA transferase